MLQMGKNKMELASALEAIEREVGLDAPLGASNLPPRARFRTILTLLRDKLCPQLGEVKRVLNTEKASLGSAVADLVIVSVAKLEAPAATIGRSIAIVGIDTFCKDPASILDVR